MDGVFTKSLKALLAFCLLFSGIKAEENPDTVIVDVNLDINHVVGDISLFDREKFINIHSDIGENEWDGDNFTDDLRDHFLNGFDVYMGRNTGGISWYLNNRIGEDPSRSGFADPADIQTYGQNVRNSFAANTEYHAYENRNDQVLAAQLHPFWPDGQQTNVGWAFSQEDTQEIPFGTATGEYMGRFIKEFFGTGGTTGQERPDLVEVINEPVWHLVDYGNENPDKIFEFHNAVASEIRKYNDNIKIGGYCTAFPDHEKNNFQEWETRWKSFMDIAGENMDFWAIHLYDFPAFGGKEQYRKGAQMEATLDMMEHYSYLSFGEVKPFVISEFGAQTHDYWDEWSPYRDWLFVKSVNSMLLQFMERPNLISKAIPFVVLKAEWGYDYQNDSPYASRLLRKANEPQSYTGEWVYTDFVRIYELWAGVKGIRVDSKATDLDILADAYVDGNRAYIIINNLDFVAQEIKLNCSGMPGGFESLNLKHLHLVNDAGIISEETFAEVPQSFTIDPEATLLLEFSFADNITVDETSNEVKYYATDYFRGISANTPIGFNINNVSVGTHGEATLRLGVGRAHGKSIYPEVVFNDEILDVPHDHRGGNQEDRDSFFGVLEIPVPYSLLQTENSFSVEFEDEGGYISSVSLQAYEFSRSVERSKSPANTAIVSLSQSSLSVGPNPAHDFFTLSSTSQERIKRVQLFNLSGEVVLSKEVDGFDEKVNVSGLSQGVYLVRIYTGKGVYGDRLMVR